MVLLGGLEVFAAGYIIHQHQKSRREKVRKEEVKEEEQWRRQHERRHDRKYRSRRDLSGPSGDSSYRGRAGKTSEQPLQQLDVMEPISNYNSTPSFWVPAEPPQTLQFDPMPNFSPALDGLSQQDSVASSSSPRIYPTSSASPLPAHPPPPSAPSIQHSWYTPSSQGIHELYTREPHHIDPHVCYLDPFNGAYSKPQPARSDSGRRQRSASRVRFALPLNGNGSHMKIVEPGSPPPPYYP